MNPMMLPFVMYQRWLDMIFLPFVKQGEATSNSAMKEVAAVQLENFGRKKKAAAYEG